VWWFACSECPRVRSLRLTLLASDRLSDKMMMMDRSNRDELKTISLTTSKTNYIDPRIIAAWAKRESVPIERVLPATLREKFPWALAVEET
jgi:hypothetical protein